MPPLQHLLDLSLLSAHDVPGELLYLGVFALLKCYLGHLYGRLVVGDHGVYERLVEGVLVRERVGTRAVAEAELRVLNAREERVRELEADRDALIASYAEVVPEALNELSGEERVRVYRMLQLEVRPDPEGYEVSGAFCSSRPTGRRR